MMRWHLGSTVAVELPAGATGRSTTAPGRPMAFNRERPGSTACPLLPDHQQPTRAGWRTEPSVLALTDHPGQSTFAQP